MKLIIEDDDGRKTVVPFVRDEISIGRKDGNTIRLTERNVSRRHARLSRGNGHVFIEDLGSYNGVKVNGGKVAGRAEIKEGDLIEIGDYNLAIQLEAADAERSNSGAEPSTVPGAPALDSQALHAAPTAPQQRPQAPPPPAQPVAAPRPAPSSQRPVAGPPTSAPAGGAPQPIAQQRSAPEPSGGHPAPSRSAMDPPPRAESTAVIRIDLEALNRSDERRPLPPGERPRLVALSSSYAGQSFEIDHTSASIGRTVDNDITVDHRSLSRHHCRIYLDQDGTWKVLDRGSANGVRVNGEEYGLIDLRRGDVVELGHVKMRFCDAGDPFVYTEDAARAHAASPPKTSVGPQKKRSLVPILAIAGVGGAALVALAIIFIGGPKGDGQETGPSPDLDLAATSGEQVREAIQSAGDAAEKEMWAEAIQAYRRALALEPSSSTATQGLERVESEARAQQVFEAAVTALRSADWAAAWEGMAAIPEGSIYSERIGEHRDRITEGYLTLVLGRASESLRKSDWDEAIREADAVLALSPGHTRASDIKTRAESGHERDERARLAAEAEEERRQQVALARQQRQQQRTQRPQKASTTKEAAPDNRQEAQQAFEAGRGHVQRNEFRDAIVQLERALRLDPRGQSIAHALLGTSYARLGDNQKAYMHYRRFLDTNPNHPQAPQVRQIVEEFERSRPQ